MSDCLFCRIATGELPAQKVYEDDAVIAFLDIKPTNPGHLLVVPKQHSADLLELPEEQVSPLFSVARKLAWAAKAAVKADGINLIVNSGSAAGQVIFHTHLHVVPRFIDDGLRHWPGHDTSEGELQKLAGKIKQELG